MATQPNRKVPACSVCGALGVPLPVRFVPSRRDGQGILKVCKRACLETLYDVSEMVASGLWHLEDVTPDAVAPC